MVFRRLLSRYLGAIIIAFSLAFLTLLILQTPSDDFPEPRIPVGDLTQSGDVRHGPTNETRLWSSIDQAIVNGSASSPAELVKEFNNVFTSPLGLDQIVDSINFLNAHHEVLNADVFGPVNNASVSVVIVVQVHDRIEYLRYLISTLRNSTGIESALLVFSHDLRSEPINALIRSITFCRVIQIFYPYNIQIFSNVFPGQDPHDCPERISKDEAHAMNCTNWAHPDKYGHYRIARITQIKHHWWWKMNYVFDGIVKQYGLESYVLLLEEDHYVSPDFLHVLNFMVANRQAICADCRVLCLGFYLKNYKTYRNDIDKLGVHTWFSSKHNMGMAINSETWELIRKCSDLFCTYDDYNWDWSMLQVSLKCMPAKMKVIFAKAPRVIHVGDCGVHTHRCGVHNAADGARKLFDEVRPALFPAQLRATDFSKRMLKASKPNGGWGDVRDHRLCLNNTRPLNQSATSLAQVLS
ncbi:UDP-GlcNAc:a-6-D-mannoside b1,2-N-acetylglucosaminyltransferase II [Aphelenchoides avenae]|nr:UDP-GlcNAc:a-6-D-mannoside b1,2-N-acetylglucosaminyltransferase II [Aphelenchus avenae]